MPAEKQIRTLKVGPVAISDEAFEGIMDTAGYSIGYWANSCTWDDEAKTLTVVENDEGENETHTVSYEKIHETFWMIVNPEKELKLNSTIRGYFVSSVLDGIAEGQGDIDAGHIDGDAADALIQFALFGELVYG